MRPPFLFSAACGFGCSAFWLCPYFFYLLRSSSRCLLTDIRFVWLYPDCFPFLPLSLTFGGEQRSKKFLLFFPFGDFWAGFQPPSFFFLFFFIGYPAVRPWACVPGPTFFSNRFTPLPPVPFHFLSNSGGTRGLGVFRF